MTIKVGINGFGRIGRVVFRAINKDFNGLEVVGVNDLLDNEYLAYMLKYDSVHGRFGKDVVLEGNNFVIDGKKIRLSSERNPADLKWDEVGVDVVIDCTGFFLTEESCQAHLDAGAKKVIQSAPAKFPGWIPGWITESLLVANDYNLGLWATQTAPCLLINVGRAVRIGDLI